MTPVIAILVSMENIFCNGLSHIVCKCNSEVVGSECRFLYVNYECSFAVARLRVLLGQCPIIGLAVFVSKGFVSKNWRPSLRMRLFVYAQQV